MDAILTAAHDALSYERYRFDCVDVHALQVVRLIDDQSLEVKSSECNPDVS